MDPHDGFHEVWPEATFRQLQPPPIPGDCVVVGDGAVVDDAQRLAPSLVGVGDEGRSLLLGLDGKGRVVLGHVVVFEPYIRSIDRRHPGQPQVLWQAVLQRGPDLASNEQ